jgi:ABC-type spermidine/putrescine transport system permease subunit II
MSYTIVIIILIGIPLLIYFVVSANKKKKNMGKDGNETGAYKEGKAKDTHHTR